MFNHYYAKQEQYKDLIKEAEKERIIKQIKESQKQNSQKSGGEKDRANLAGKLALIFREARLSSSR